MPDNQMPSQFPSGNGTGLPPQNPPMGQAPQPAYRPPVGPPPAPEVNVRTMNSDIKSVERGDAMPTAESVLPKEIESEPLFSPETVNATGGPADNGSKKKIMVWLGIALVVLILGAVGYFVIYPKFSAPAVVVTPPAPVTPPTPPVAMHHSIFTVPVAEDQLHLNNLILTSITTALQNYAPTITATSGLREVAIVDKDGVPVVWNSFLKAFGTSFTDENLTAWFQDDFTAFVYKDANGIWPGYIAQFKATVATTGLMTALKPLEASDISKFFISPVGTVGNFKDGTLGTIKTRYALGGKPGAGFNYAIVNDKYLLISTSYKGMQEALKAIGL